MRLTAATLRAMTSCRPHSRSPYYRRWRTLHKKHVAAYRRGDLGEACTLADAKYRLYLDACKWAALRAFGLLPKRKLQRGAGRTT